MKTLFSKNGRGFTLVEILIVIIIIGILAALVLSIASNVITSAKKSRAAGEVAALDMALSRFQVDNGFFPTATNISTNVVILISGVSTNHYYVSNPALNATTNGYRMSGRALFLALMGRTTYDYTAGATNTNNGRQYYTDLKASQVGDESVLNTNMINPDPTVAATYTTGSFSTGSYIIDPFQNAYGYYYNANSISPSLSLYNQTAPDIWSTCGETNNFVASSGAGTNTYLLLRWAHNWPQNAQP